jgi:hypothetical protein
VREPQLPRAVRFTGTIHNVTMDVSGDLIKDQAAETRILIARQ